MTRRLTSRLLLATAIAATPLLLSACSKSEEKAPAVDTTAEAAAPAAEAAAPAATEAAPAATPVAAAAPTADSTDTLSGAKFADFTGDAAKGEKSFVVCKTCHTVEAGVNRIGPSLHSLIGRHSGEIPGFTYSPANKNSGITWSEAKLFQYLEKPQRVIPGTKMTFVGIKDPQTRADVIAYLKTQG